MEKSKSAQAGIITTVLLILLVLAAVIIVWVVVKNLVTESTGGIGTQALTTQLDIQEANLYVTGGGEVKIKREPGEGEITALKFIFYSEDGESVIIERDDKIPNELEIKIYDFTVEQVNINVDKVSVVPMFGKKAGMEFSEDKPNVDLIDETIEPISWWKFDGNANDKMGRNDGDLIGGNFDGNVLNLDGINDYVDTVDIDESEGIEAITLSLWIYPIDNLDRYIMGKNGPYYLRKVASGRIQCGIDTSKWDFPFGSSDVVPVLNEWNHIVCTYNNPTVNIYVKGFPALESHTHISGGVLDSTGDTFKIGYFSGSYFNGSIDDVMIFNQALTPEQIKAIYNNQIK